LKDQIARKAEEVRLERLEEIRTETKEPESWFRS